MLHKYDDIIYAIVQKGDLVGVTDLFIETENWTEKTSKKEPERAFTL